VKIFGIGNGVKDNDESSATTEGSVAGGEKEDEDSYDPDD
jgi:hypothetical protein